MLTLVPLYGLPTAYRGGYSRCLTARRLCKGDFPARTDCWRPTVDDVERISWGKPAKKKGTGSRGVPHRLNADERELYDLARRKGFLEITGSGWRSQRREAPLANTYRSLCDARAQPTIVLHKSNDGITDVVAVDLSPLRLPDAFEEVQQKCVAAVEREADADATSVDGVDGEVEMAVEDSPSLESEPQDSLDGADQWETQPIYHLPPHVIQWTLPRAEAKALAKSLAKFFSTSEEAKSGGAQRKSRKPNVKPGKSRRHGGYGIG